MMSDLERRILQWLEERQERTRAEVREALELMHELRKHHRQRLTRIQIVFKPQHHHQHHHHHQGEKAMAQVPGPLTLTTLGAVAIASILGFDQDDKPMAADFVFPPVHFSTDNPDAVSATENADGETAAVTAEAEGTANIIAEVDTVDADGNPITLEDSAVVTVTLGPPPPPPAQRLSRIQIVFDANPPAATSGAGATGAADASTAAGAEEPSPEGQATTADTTGATDTSTLTPNQLLQNTVKQTM